MSSEPRDIPTVFVVDDDVSVRESLELLIRFEGWRPETFASAQEFLAGPRVAGPSCLVLDVSLPDLNGLELQERVAAERLDIPIIFITGHGDIPMTVRAMKAGAVEFLTKPFDDNVLLGAIRNAIERNQAALGSMKVIVSSDEKGFVPVYSPKKGGHTKMSGSPFPLRAVICSTGITSSTMMPTMPELPAGPSILTEFCKVMRENAHQTKPWRVSLP
jgi:DNA-binding response OmpR family regulator